MKAIVRAANEQFCFVRAKDKHSCRWRLTKINFIHPLFSKKVWDLFRIVSLASSLPNNYLCEAAILGKESRKTVWKCIRCDDYNFKLVSKTSDYLLMPRDYTEWVKSDSLTGYENVRRKRGYRRRGISSRQLPFRMASRGRLSETSATTHRRSPRDRSRDFPTL